MTDKVCVESDAPQMPCCICGKMVHTCSSEESIDGPDGCDFTCPAHPEGDQLSNGKWVCSEECWDEAVAREDRKNMKEKIVLRTIYLIGVILSVLMLLSGWNDAWWLAIPCLPVFLLSLYWFIYPQGRNSDVYQHVGEEDGG